MKLVLYKLIHVKSYTKTNIHIQINVYEFVYTNSYIQNCIKNKFTYKLRYLNLYNTN